MIALTQFQLEFPFREESLRGAARATQARETVAKVRVDIVASGKDLDRLLAVLSDIVPGVRERVPQRSVLPDATPLLPPGPVVLEGELEEPR